MTSGSLFIFVSLWSHSGWRLRTMFFSKNGSSCRYFWTAGWIWSRGSSDVRPCREGEARPILDSIREFAGLWDNFLGFLHNSGKQHYSSESTLPRWIFKKTSTTTEQGIAVIALARAFVWAIGRSNPPNGSKQKTTINLKNIPQKGGGIVKTFRWEHRLQRQNLFMAFKRVPRYGSSNIVSTV